MKSYPINRFAFGTLVVFCLLAGTGTFAGLKPAAPDLSPEQKLASLLAEGEELEYRDTRKSQALHEEALKLAIELGDIRGQIAARIGIGSAISRMGDNTGAIRQYRTAMDLSNQIDDPELLSDIHISLGTSYFDLGDYERALISYQESLQLRAGTGDVERIAKSRTNIGNVYWMMEEHEKALVEFEQALAAFQEIGFELGVAGLSINVGKGYLELNKPARAMDMFNQSLALFTRLGNPYGTAMANACIGDMLMAQGKPDAALARHVQALKTRKEAGDAKGEIDSMVAAAESCIQLKRFEEAHEYLRIALARSIEREMPNEQKHVYRVYTDLYEAQGRQDKALSFYRKYVDLREELQRGEKEQNIQEIQARYKVEQELEKLQHEADMAELELRLAMDNRNLWIMLAAITAILGSVSLVLYFQKVGANRKLSRLARLDPLTGLSNRRDILERIIQEFARSRRSGNPFALLMLDADHFKKINDQYGHATGDNVLEWLATRIQRILRESDHAARWGGEEFLVLLPYTGMSGSTRFAERLLEEITAVPFMKDDITIPVTVTIGVAKVDPERDKSPEDLINRADAAMYTGKEQGRNQVVVANWNGA